MSSSFSDTTSKLHAPLAASLQSLKAKEITQAEARKLFEAEHPEMTDATKWVFLSDHCSNHVVKGSCQCAGTADALVERLARNRYRVL